MALRDLTIMDAKHVPGNTILIIIIIIIVRQYGIMFGLEEKLSTQAQLVIE